MSRTRQPARQRWSPWLLPLLIAACSAPVSDADALRGERAEARGDTDTALRAYKAALTRCTHGDRLSRRQRQQCASTYLARAELLERTGQKRQAADWYLGTPEAVPWDRAAGAAGVYRAGRLYLELGHADRGYQLLWATITHYPEQGFARDALRAVLRDGRKRDVKQLYQVLGDLLQPLADTGIADNILYALAELAEHNFDDIEAARAHYDKIAGDYPKSTMRDDALWHGARLARQLGDGAGAARRLRLLLATREVAFGTGSYFSVWLDNGQLELGRVLRDDLRDHRGALDAFALLPEHYPASVLIDDALWERARTWRVMGEAERACATLDVLAKKWPESKYRLHDAPQLRQQIGCGPAPAAAPEQPDDD